LQAGHSLLGMTREKLDTDLSNNYIAFLPIPTGIRSIVMFGGVPNQADHVLTWGPEEIDKFRISVHYEDEASDRIRIRFWLNEVLLRTVESPDIPFNCNYINFYLAATGGVGNGSLFYPRYWLQEVSTYDRYI